MEGDFYINNKDAWKTWGANMGDSFLENLLTPPPAKSYVTNKSRAEDGKQVLYNNPRLDERDVQLTITIEGSTLSEYLQRYESFLNEIANGEILLKVPILTRVYKLYYSSSPSQVVGRLGFGKFIFSFNEPNPKDRESI